MAKFLNIQLLMLLFMISSHLFMFVAVVLANMIKPGLEILSHSLNGQTVVVNAVNTYVVMLAFCALQFWFGLRFKNFIVPIAVGLALWLTGTLLVFYFNSGTAKYFPYSFQAISLSPKHKIHLTQVAWTSAGYAVFFLLVGFLDFRRRGMNK